MNDYEILLLSWTQLIAVQLIMGENQEMESLHVIEDRLEEEFNITNPSLVGRTYDEYTVAYERSGEPQLISFDADEVESIYDL